MKTTINKIAASSGTKLTCFHCGEPCKSTDIAIDDNVFCCQGCRLVYELLSENDLTTYYGYYKHPGISQQGKQITKKYQFLDNPEIKQKLLDFSENGIATVTLSIPQIHCSSCIWLLENLYRLNPAIPASRVNFLRKELTVTFQEEKISLRQVVELLASIGYEPQITSNDLEQPRRRHVNRSLYLKLGVAGFAFGNIMLLSFPDYLATHEVISPEFIRFFGYLSLLLSLPVLLYSSQDYFRSALAGIRQRYLNIDVPISLGILAMFGRSVYEVISATGTGYLDSMAGLVFFLLIGKLFQQKTYDALSFERDYKSYFPISVTKLDRGRESHIPLSQLHIGDRILVHNQELIPADAVLMSESATIDYSFVTGEAAAVHKANGDLLFAGGRQIGPSIEIEIIKEVSQSYLTRLWNNEVFHKASPHVLSNFANNVAHYFTLVVLTIAIAAALFWLSRDISTAINVFTAVLIIACPCALALSVPFAMGNALRIFGKSKFYLKSAESIETLAKVDSIVFDKTGTLTWQGKIKVQFFGIEAPGAGLSRREKRLVQSVVRHSTHPLSAQIYSSLDEEPCAGPVTDFREIQGVGLSARVDGAHIRIGSRTWLGAQEPRTDAAAQNGGTSSTVFLEIDGRVRGYFNIANHYRAGMQETIAALQKKYHIALLTGDNDRERPFLSRIFGAGSQLLFNQSPQDKLQFVKSLQQQGHRVLMIGDGLNDAGALKQSNFGISISDDILAFSPASDAILEAKVFANIEKFLHYSQICLKVVITSFALSFLYNLVGLGFGASGMLSPLVAAILMPLSSISVVAFTTFATKLFAKKLRLA